MSDAIQWVLIVCLAVGMTLIGISLSLTQQIVHRLEQRLNRIDTTDGGDDE